MAASVRNGRLARIVATAAIEIEEIAVTASAANGGAAATAGGAIDRFLVGWVESSEPTGSKLVGFEDSTHPTKTSWPPSSNSRNSRNWPAALFTKSRITSVRWA